MTKSIRRICIGIFLAIVLLSFSQPFNPLGAAKASSLTDSRVRQLEAQVRSLQTQVSQIQSQRGSSGGAAAYQQPNSSQPGPYELTPEQQFDNLATLDIEINQRVAALESQIEQR